MTASVFSCADPAASSPEISLEAIPVGSMAVIRVDDPRGVYNRLIEAGIIVRDRSRIRGCEGCLRVSIGTPAENERVLDVLKSLDA